MALINFTAATEPFDRTIEAEGGTVWSVRLRPILPNEARECFLIGSNDGSALSRIAERALLSVLVANVVKKTTDDKGNVTGQDLVGEVGVNGRPATDAGTGKFARSLVLRGWADLTDRIAIEAMKAGKLVEAERGNLSPAPA